MGNEITALPDDLRLEKINGMGWGLIANKRLKRGHDLGISHYRVHQEDIQEFNKGFAREPLGRFVNHSEEANCEFVTEGRITRVVVKKYIMSGEQILVDYKTHPCGEGYDYSNFK